MKTIGWFALAAVIFFGTCLYVVRAEAQTTLGAGIAFSDLDGESSENVVAFLDYAYPLNDGSMEVDENGDEIWYPNWYVGVGYSVKGDDDPINMAYIPISMRIGNSDAFLSVGPQFEFWDESLFGDSKTATGVRVGLELPGAELSGVPLRATFSYVEVDGISRKEFAITGTN